jgi:hypothetical protein
MTGSERRRQAQSRVLSSARAPPLDPLDQEPKHTLEQQDLIFTISLSAGEKEIGHAPHGLGAALGELLWVARSSSTIRDSFAFGFAIMRLGCREIAMRSWRAQPSVA